MSISIDDEGKVAGAAKLIGDIAYSIVFDTTNEMISAGFNQAKALECANNVMSRYVEGSIKIRKKPAPRAPKPKAAPQNDVTTAASSKRQSVSGSFVWVSHPEDSNYQYTTSAKLATGYPLKDTNNNKIVGVIGDESISSLTMRDAKIATSFGLQVDRSSIEK